MTPGPSRRLRSRGERIATVMLTLLLIGGAALPSRSATGRADRAGGIAVHYPEGTVHGFLSLRTEAGALLAHGDLTQVVRDAAVDSRMVFHFPDASVFDERVTFTQKGVFAMQVYHLVQSGPAFADDIEVALDHSGRYLVKSTTHKDGTHHQYAGVLDLPPDVYNGMVITIAKNVSPRAPETVHIVAFTPEPRLIGLVIAPFGTHKVTIGQHVETATDYALKPQLGTLLHFFARVLGKVPPDSHTWIVSDQVPAFVRYEGPLYTGPVWRIELVAPAWPP